MYLKDWDNPIIPSIIPNNMTVEPVMKWSKEVIAYQGSDKIFCGFFPVRSNQRSWK